MKKTSTLLSMLALLTGGAFAAPIKIDKEDRAALKAAMAAKDADVPPELRTPSTDVRIEKLRLLIIQGVKEKQLTPGEQTSLTNELKRIEREEEAYKHNKRVGPRERNDLKRDINKLHERLFEKLNNGTKPAEPLAR